MSAADFRSEVRRLRDLQRLSRTALAQRSGVSAQLIEKLEMSKDPPQPRRTTVIDLAGALGWDLDEALAATGYDPITEDEKAALATVHDPRVQLDRMWDDLTAAQQAAIVVVVQAMLNPNALVRLTREGTVAMDYWPSDDGEREANGEPIGQEPAGS